VADDLGLLPERVVEQLVLDLLGIAAPKLTLAAISLTIGPTRSAIAFFGTSSCTAMLPQAMSKPTPLTEMCSS
jgi:hypothetical protein